MITNTQFTRRKKIREKPCLDRLSNLHESVVSHILSRLPTNYAAQTSVLSKAWKYKWTSSYNIEIDKKYWPKGRIFNNGLMDKMLNSPRHLSSKILRRFHVSCENYGNADWVQKWVSQALRRRRDVLECFEVEFCLTHNDSDDYEGIVLPDQLLNSNSLRKLSIRGNQYSFILFAGAQNCAPNLTSLYLTRVQIENSSNVAFNFPVLESFELESCSWLNVKMVEIYAPSLTTFSSNPRGNYKDYDYTIKIVAPRLTTISCSSEKFCLNESSIVSALTSSGTSLIESIGMRTKELELSDFMASGLPLLYLHDKLTRVDMGISSYVQLFDLLQVMPSLKYICLALFCDPEYNIEAAEYVPSCVIFHLEEVVFEDRRIGQEPEYKLAEFLFKTAKLLKKFTYLIHGQSSQHEEIKQVLSTFDLCSPSLTIDVCSLIKA